MTDYKTDFESDEIKLARNRLRKRNALVMSGSFLKQAKQALENIVKR